MFKKLIQFTIFFGGIVLYWNFQDKRDFDKVFKVVEGDIIGPVAVTDVQGLLLINNQLWGNFRKELNNGQARIDLDSILIPFRANQLSQYNDTLPAVNKIEWDKMVDQFDQKALQKDTFLIQGYRDTIRINIQQIAAFNAKYIFGIDNEPYEFSINEWKKTEKFMTYFETLRFEDFENHVLKVNELFNGLQKIKVTYRYKLSEFSKQFGAVRSNIKSPYLIEKIDGTEIYKYESGFEMLANDGEYWTWWDDILLKIIFWLFVAIWIFLAIGSLLSPSREPKG
jgi:hypothetical protein